MILTKTFASVVTLVALTAASDGTVEFGMKRRHAAQARPRASQRRDGTLLRPLHFNDHWLDQGGYFIDVEIGTPPQHVEVLLDTGSSNLFVANSEAEPCQEYYCPGGSFDSAASSTFKIVQEPYLFNISYADGSLVVGNYSSDVVSLGDATLKDLEFGLANYIQVSPGQGPAAAQYGIMGVSFDGSETSACTQNATYDGCIYNFTFPTVPDALYNAGYIKSRSYSLYMDNLQEDKGSILFGGIDTTKFTGELDTLAVQLDVTGDPQNGTYVGLNVLLTSIAASFNGTPIQLSSDKLSQTVQIDSGTAGLALPDPFFTTISNALTPVFQLNGANVILCKYARDTNVYLTLGLTGADGTETSIDVPLWAFLVPYFGNGTYNATTPVTQDGEEVCLVTLEQGALGSEPLLLGDPLFRSSYINFNLDEKTISFAQAVYNTTTSNVVAVGPGPVPKLTGTGNPASDWNSTSGVGVNPPQGNGTAASATATASATAGVTGSSTASGTATAPSSTSTVTPYTGAAGQTSVNSWAFFGTIAAGFASLSFVL